MPDPSLTAVADTSPADPGYACAGCGRTNAGHHARGVCSNCYKQRRDEFPRKRRYQPYTAKDRAYIRAQWGKVACAEIAAALGRTAQDVYSAAVRFGAAKPRHVLKTDPALREQLVSLHAEGLSDREIGEKVGFGHGTVARWLRRMGVAVELPDQADRSVSQTLA